MNFGCRSLIVCRTTRASFQVVHVLIVPGERPTKSLLFLWFLQSSPQRKSAALYNVKTFGQIFRFILIVRLWNECTNYKYLYIWHQNERDTWQREDFFFLSTIIEYNNVHYYWQNCSNSNHLQTHYNGMLLYIFQNLKLQQNPRAQGVTQHMNWLPTCLHQLLKRTLNARRGTHDILFNKGVPLKLFWQKMVPIFKGFSRNVGRFFKKLTHVKGYFL